MPEPVLASLRWPGRPKLAEGNPAWTYMIEHPHGHFALFVGHVDEVAADLARHFEIAGARDKAAAYRLQAGNKA